MNQLQSYSKSWLAKAPAGQFWTYFGVGFSLLWVLDLAHTIWLYWAHLPAQDMNESGIFSLLMNRVLLKYDLKAKCHFFVILHDLGEKKPCHGEH